MAAIFHRLLRVFRSPTPVPAAYRQTFLHLYLEIAWFGILTGTTIAFIAVYATRMGASPQQIGLLSAAPALVNLIFALPAGSWLSHRSISKSVFWTSILQRMFYLALIPLPVLLLPEAQVWVIILMTLLMTVPGTVAVVGFNSLFGEVVPLEWRGQVVGIRNALLSATTTIFTLISGWILSHMAFPANYQIVFAIGVIGAVVSSLHLYMLASIVGHGQKIATTIEQPRTAAGRKLAGEIRGLYQRGVRTLRLDAMKGHFARLMALLFAWHLIQFMAIPVVTPFVVNQLHVSDQLIGLAGGLFNGSMFLGSLQLSRISARLGNKKLTGGAMMMLSVFPIFTALGPGGYVMANLIVGLAWSMAGGALYNYILENCPPDDRPAHLAWYSLVSNGAILIGSMVGPVIAAEIGFSTALIIFGIGRLLAGAAILRWG